MKKIINYVLLILFVALCLAGCSPKTNELPKYSLKVDTPEAPKISITINDTEIEYAVGFNQWNGVMYDRLDTFYSIFNDSPDFEAPYFELGEKIEINFKNNPPDKLNICDSLMNSTGDYGDIVIESGTIEASCKNDIYSFELKAQPVPSVPYIFKFTSNVYGKEKIIRGFQIVCTWGSNECEYAFVVATDAD